MKENYLNEKVVKIQIFCSFADGKFSAAMRICKLFTALYIKICLYLKNFLQLLKLYKLSVVMHNTSVMQL